MADEAELRFGDSSLTTQFTKVLRPCLAHIQSIDWQFAQAEKSTGGP